MNKKIFIWISIFVVSLLIIIGIVLISKKDNVTKNETGIDEIQINEDDKNQENTENDWKKTIRSRVLADNLGTGFFNINVPKHEGLLKRSWLCMRSNGWYYNCYFRTE